MNTLRNHPDPEYILGSIPLVNNLEAPHPKYELGFRWLPEGNLQLTEFVDPADMFSNYSYRSSLLSAAHIDERRDWARRAYDAANAEPPDSVLEIACNDGYMLNRYADDGLLTTIVGCDPGRNLHQYIDDSVYAYPRLFGSETAEAIRTLHGTFDIIHAHNVVAHTPDPSGMLKAMKQLMHLNSAAVVEFQYMPDVIENALFYNFYHEHYYYLSLSGIWNLAYQAGMGVVEAKRIGAQGGSVLVSLCNRPILKTEALDRLMTIEAEWFNQPQIFHKFATRTERALKRFVEWVNMWPEGTLYGLCASAKAAVILNLAVERGLQLDRFNCFYDDADTKWGFTVPGTELEIRAMHPIEKPRVAACCSRRTCTLR